MKKKIFNLLLLFIFGIAGGIFADQIFWPYFVEKPLFHQYRLDQAPIYISETKEITILENTALQEAVERAGKMVIRVKSLTKAGQTLEGCGLILSSDGLVLTLAELVPSGAEFSFFVEGRAQDYQILKRDIENNLALVKLEAQNLPSCGFAPEISLGEKVFLAGLVSSAKAETKVVNSGIIKAFESGTQSAEPRLIKINMLEGPELKGSPLFNIRGQTVGLIILTDKGEVSAIPVSVIRNFVGL